MRAFHSNENGLFCTHPLSIVPLYWWKERGKQEALIWMKNSHLNRTLQYLSLKPCSFWLKIVKNLQRLLVFDWHCRILILTCTVDFGNNGPNCNVSLLIQGFTNSLLLVAYFLSPCKIIFIYTLIETFKMYYIVKTNHFQ